MKLLPILSLVVVGSATAFTSPQQGLASTSVSTSTSTTLYSIYPSKPRVVKPQPVYEPVFDFSDPSKNTVASFDRIDDAIMGGISSSTVTQIASNSEYDEESFAKWSGVCRTDGGGFCGFRTLPFQDGVPLKVEGEDGFYLKVRLTSDNEPERRVWKFTTRDENVSRTEAVYQAQFEVPKQTQFKDGTAIDAWKTIQIPFSSFIQVRGPRKVENGKPLDVSGGLYQIGLSLSKFVQATEMTELEDFKPGFFELQIREIGVYKADGAADAVESAVDTPNTVTKAEANKDRPLIFKLLFPFFKIFFNEKLQRKKSATKILKERGWNVAKFGFMRKVYGRGIIPAVIGSLFGLVTTTLRVIAFNVLKLALFYPLVALRRTLKKLMGSGTEKAETA